MADDYITSAALKATLTLTGETYADADVAAAITAASRAIDESCNRRFWDDADANQVRHYTPTSNSLVLIDDVVTVTSVKTDTAGDYSYATTLVADTDFLLEPFNAVDDSRPYTALRANPRTGYVFYRYPKWVQVTGKFGWSAVPAAISQATTIHAARLLKRSREAPFGVTSLGGLDGVGVRVVRFDPDVEALINPYRRLTV